MYSLYSLKYFQIFFFSRQLELSFIVNGYFRTLIYCCFELKKIKNLIKYCLKFKTIETSKNSNVRKSLYPLNTEMEQFDN